VLASAAALAWLYLLALHGGYWLTRQRLPSHGPADGALPQVTAVIPARNEAEVLPGCLPSLLSQRYDGQKGRTRGAGLSLGLTTRGPRVRRGNPIHSYHCESSQAEHGYTACCSHCGPRLPGRK